MPWQRPTVFSIISNAFPVFANDCKNDVDMSPQQMDNVIKYQLSLRHSRYLDVHSLVFSGVCDHIKVAGQVHKLLVKHGFILPAPTSGPAAFGAGGDVMTVDTYKIDKKFSHRLSIISVHAHRKLVGLLFFWEEEVNRWRLLDKEENEIRQLLKTVAGHAAQDLSVALEAAQIKKRLLPSERAEGASNVFPPMQETLPSYA